MSTLELELDFAEEGLEFIAKEELLAKIGTTISKIDDLLGRTLLVGCARWCECAIVEPKCGKIIAIKLFTQGV